ncbi:lipopolysaccharide assembly LapA domain-containing protein [Saccharothrix saharensis]|uniref:LapA family protein n=1 Tax=Saccharothrix saharensis TaxID=571190 RepID=UPI0036D0B4DE
MTGAPERRAGTRAKLKPTRISGTWVAVLASIVVLIVLLVFILQNLTDATIHFLGAEGTLPLGVALLFAAIAGAILVALVGAARIMQLRRQAKRGLR